MLKCKSCGQPISFQSTKGGKMMPVQRDRIKILSKDGEIVEGHEPHWAHCPNADKHRRKKVKKSDETS